MNTLYNSVEITEALAESPSVLSTDQLPKISKQALRTTLKASTIDEVFATIFSNITSGVLIINFLLQLGANPVEIGLLSSIPMLVNFIQPLGAYIADRMTSRHWYVLLIFGPARLLWLFLVGGIAWFSWHNGDSRQLVTLTLGIILISSILISCGCSPWFSWMAALVPHRLRGRYFGLRNSAASLTNLISVPLLGFAISSWPGGSIQGYGVVLLLGIVFGIVSLICQFWMTDVNPQIMHSPKPAPQQTEIAHSQSEILNIFKNTNYLKLVVYLALWTFGMSLSLPFFNIYMLRNLDLDLGLVTIYTSLMAGATLLTLIFWGKLADRLGNRPLLLLVGTLMAVSPLFWLGVGTDSVSIWIWIPLIQLMSGAFGAAITLCSSNIQMEVAPIDRPSQYFAIAAAVMGITGGLGSAVGGFLADLDATGGLLGLFVISAVLRLIALLPLVFVQEPRSQHIVQIFRNILRQEPQPTESSPL
ncbi:MAG: MFS transporter [Rhizonema sp. NSF051]|nr:MFS transporter [Rhizonema sp. NSF051]